MTARTTVPVVMALAVGLGLITTGCATATATCAIRHRYAIVVFQGGLGENRKSFVTRFRLNVKYGTGQLTRRMVATRVVLKAAQGGNPPLVIRTYHVGNAESCGIDHLRARR